ncbi:MAG TPA: AAA family ATPase, partial [Methanoculleus sp.]|nr:AAA family ATPase [Methanoculleus sp.]
MPKRFTHISLWNWRNFQRVDMDLQARVFLVGPNASGKSNFLDVFKFLRDIVSVGGGFQGAVKERGGVSSLRALSARKYSDIGIMVRLGNAERDDLWEYELTFRQDERNLPVIAKERVARCGNEVIARPSAQDEEDPERLTQTYLEQVNVNKDFREVADFLKTTRYLH